MTATFRLPAARARRSETQERDIRSKQEIRSSKLKCLTAGGEDVAVKPYIEFFLLVLDIVAAGVQIEMWPLAANF